MILKNLVTRISDRLEIVIVLSLCFGFPILTSVYIIAIVAVSERSILDDTVLWSLLIYEVVVFVICAGFLYLRNYRLWQNIQFNTSLRASGIALLLVLGSYAAYYGLWIAMSLILYPNTIPVPELTNSATIAPILLVSLINPMFEELFVVGFLFDKLQGLGPIAFVIISALIRTSYHLYQGWVGVISILPLGIIFAFTYYKYRNLMPLYLSHALMDLSGLTSTS